MRIAHLSDLHFGRHVSSDRVDALRTDLVNADPELVVITGDITDRGSSRQFHRALQFLQSLNIQFISVPGNREVSFDAFWEWAFPRLALLRYQSYFGPKDRIVHVSEEHKVVFFGVNSVHPLPSWPGTMGRKKRDWLRKQALDFQGYFKVLFLHHPVLPVPGSSSNWAHTFSDAGKVLKICSETGISLILQGHKHRSSVMDLRIPDTNARIVVSCSGAPLRPEWDAIYHLIRISPTTVLVEPREFIEGRFTPRHVSVISFDGSGPSATFKP